MSNGRHLHTLQTSIKYPCAVCRKGVGKNSLFCNGCWLWVQKRCSDIPERLLEDPDLGVQGVLVMHGQQAKDL